MGLSIHGLPITRMMLVERGFKGADRAIITPQDILALEDTRRRDALKIRLETKLRSQGEMISGDNIVNLVPLAVAAEYGCCGVVRTRLLAGVNPNQMDDSESPPIVAAVKGGFEQIVRLLAEHPKIDKKALVTAIEAAQRFVNPKIAEYLSSLLPVDEKDERGDALIHKMTRARDSEKVRQLLKRGADSNLENAGGSTPLKIAASNKDIELLRLLLASGADPNKYTDPEFSPLALAARSGNLEGVRLLLPVTEKRDFKKTVYYTKTPEERIIPWYVPLMFSSYESKEWLQILRFLQENGANINAIGCDGETVLNLFLWRFPERFMRGERDSEKGLDTLLRECEILSADTRRSFAEKLEQLDTLLSMGADPRILCGSDKSTALHVFLEKIDLGFLEGATEQVLARLLDRGVDVNCADAYGRTPLHIAARTYNANAAAYLIKRGARVNERTDRGRTPLHLAAAGGPRITRLLIEAQADVNAVDGEGRTPLALSKLACIQNDRQYVHPSDERGEPYREAQKVLIAAGGK